jgi:hypothetical protein
LSTNLNKKFHKKGWIYRNDADVLGSCHSLFLANHRSSNQIALMEKANLKLTNTISSLITDDLKKEVYICHKLDQVKAKNSILQKL